MLEIPTKTLLVVAAAVWLAAGSSVIYVGITAALDGWNVAIAIAFAILFVLFLLMFLSISNKHIKRILSYKEKLTSLFKFFDAQSYIIIAVMIFLGAALRLSGFVPEYIIAPLYSAIGLSLLVCAIYYVITFVGVTRVLKSK